MVLAKYKEWLGRAIQLIDLKLIFINPSLIYSNPREKESERERVLTRGESSDHIYYLLRGLRP